MTEVLTRLRLELVEQLETLPEVLHSEFPDLAVDFLATVFKDALDKKAISRPAKNHKPASDNSNKPPPQLPQPSEEALVAAAIRLEELTREADRIEASAAPKLSDYGELATNIVPKDLVKCKRCQKVMVALVSAAHAAECKEVAPRLLIQPRDMPSQSTHAAGSDLTANTRKTTATRGGGGGGNAKRKRAATKEPSYTTVSIGPASHYAEAPLSPTLAAVVHLRQKRSDVGRKKRRELTFIPGSQEERSVVLNPASPIIAGSNGGPGGSVPSVRMMSLNAPNPPKTRQQQQQQQYQELGNPPQPTLINYPPQRQQQPQQQQQQQANMAFVGQIGGGAWPPGMRPPHPIRVPQRQAMQNTATTPPQMPASLVQQQQQQQQQMQLQYQQQQQRMQALGWSAQQQQMYLIQQQQFARQQMGSPVQQARQQQQQQQYQQQMQLQPGMQIQSPANNMHISNGQWVPTMPGTTYVLASPQPQGQQQQPGNMVLHPYMHPSPGVMYTTTSPVQFIPTVLKPQ